MAPTAARGSPHTAPSRPLTPREATLLMLARWDTMDAVAAEPQPRGRRDARQRSSSVPNRDGARSRVRDYEQFEAERERLRLIQVETERRADEEAARKVWEGQQEDRSKRRKAERKLQLLANRQRSETPPLIRMDELEPFDWMPPSRSAGVSASVASTGSRSAVSRGSAGSEDSVPYASASEESDVGTEVEAKASSRQWKWEITDGERSRGSRTGRKKPESKRKSVGFDRESLPKLTVRLQLVQQLSHHLLAQGQRSNPLPLRQMPPDNALIRATDHNPSPLALGAPRRHLRVGAHPPFRPRTPLAVLRMPFQRTKNRLRRLLRPDCRRSSSCPGRLERASRSCCLSSLRRQQVVQPPR